MVNLDKANAMLQVINPQATPQEPLPRVIFPILQPIVFSTMLAIRPNNR